MKILKVVAVAACLATPASAQTAVQLPADGPLAFCLGAPVVAAVVASAVTPPGAVAAVTLAILCTIVVGGGPANNGG